MDIGFLSAVELAKKIREKEISCVEPVSYTHLTLPTKA